MLPYLTITPTLDREDLNAEELFAKRKDLLDNAASYEENKFVEWQNMHAKYRELDPDDPKLNSEVSTRIGFAVAKDKMRQVMLIDTAARLPEVLMSLRKELSNFRQELEVLEERKKFRDPNHLKLMVGNLLQDVCDQIKEYLDGDLETAAKFPDFLMDLDDELGLEEDSEWFDQTLGTKASLQDEENWREIIGTMIDNSVPEHVYADEKFLGGKQFQRATKLLYATMDGVYMKHYLDSCM